MENLRFEKLILNRIHQSIDRIIIIAAVISIISAAAVYFSSIPILFAWIDFVIGVALLILFYFRKWIIPKVKVIIVVLIPIILGIATFIDGGFTSGTTILVVLGNAAAMLLLRRHVSFFIALMSTVSMFVLWIWTTLTGFDSAPEMSDTKWMIQILLMILFLFIFRISVYSI